MVWTGVCMCVCVCTFEKGGSVCIVCVSIRDLFEFGRRASSVLFRLREGRGLARSSLHKWTLPLLNRVTNVLHDGEAVFLIGSEK